MPFPMAVSPFPLQTPDYIQKQNMKRYKFFSDLWRLPPPLMKYCHCLNRQKYKQKLNSVSLLVASKKNVSNAPQISLRWFTLLRKILAIK